MNPEKPFNKLSPSEAELLALLAEECGEVIQIVGKILRHGYESCNPLQPQDGQNFQLLEKELGHIKAAVSLLEDSGAVRSYYADLQCANKLKSVKQWLHHQ